MRNHAGAIIAFLHLLQPQKPSGGASYRVYLESGASKQLQYVIDASYSRDKVFISRVENRYNLTANNISAYVSGNSYSLDYSVTNEEGQKDYIKISFKSDLTLIDNTISGGYYQANKGTESFSAVRYPSSSGGQVIVNDGKGRRLSFQISK